MNMTDDSNWKQIAAGAALIAKRNVALAMTRMGLPPQQHPTTFMPTNDTHAPAPAPFAATPAPAAPAPKPDAKSLWARAIAKANGLQETDVSDGEAPPKSKASGAWSKAIAAFNASRRD